MAEQFWGFMIPLVFAHLLADFILQSDTSVRLKHKLIYLLLHGLLVGFLSYLFVGIFSGWELLIGVGLTHILLDAWKLRSQQGTRLTRFLIDQVGHLLILALFSWAATFQHGDFAGLWINLMGRWYLLILAVLSGGILSIYVVSFLVELSFEALGINKLPASSDPEERDSLLEEELGIAEGGRIIGYLERGLITLFVLVGYPAGIGFLVAAKSIFRFGELTDSSRRWQAEYIIIGTLLSILLGSSFAYLTAWVVKVIIP
jgi:hypothetical protein